MAHSTIGTFGPSECLNVGTAASEVYNGPEDASAAADDTISGAAPSMLSAMLGPQFMGARI